MKVLKSTILKKRKCEFGNFELVPEPGWKISQSFIDYESGLLIVNESDENAENWIDTGFGSRIIPNKEHRIDTKTCEILSAEQWTKYFSYETTEQISDDGKYKLITTRVHEPERDSDGIKEEVIDMESGKKVSSSDSIAFTEEKRESLLDSLFRETKEREERKAKVDLLPSLQSFFQAELKKLRDGDVILNWINSEFIFQLSYKQDIFRLERVKKEWRYDLDWNELIYEDYLVFDSIEAFNEKFLSDKSWYLNHRPFKKDQQTPVNQLLQKFVVEFLNSLREKHDFSYQEYSKLNDWENFFYLSESIKPSEFKQYCSNCNQPVRYNPRYPKYICYDCSSKPITDENGVDISFSNIGFSGGLKITYREGDKIIKEDTSQIEKLCFIDGKRFTATEARFGGIVIQTEK
jgi:hypothetical protein